MRIYQILLVLSILTFCKKPETLTSKEKYVTVKDGLNVREAPESTGKRIATLSPGEKVTILEEKPGLLTIDNKSGLWTKISNGKIQGWAFGGFLSDTPPAAPEQKDNKDAAKNTLELAEQALNQGDFAKLLTFMSRETVETLNGLCTKLRPNQSCSEESMLQDKIKEYAPHMANKLRASAIKSIEENGNSISMGINMGGMTGTLLFVKQGGDWKINLAYDLEPREH